MAVAQRIQHPQSPAEGNFAMVRRLFREHARGHLRSYATAFLLMLISAASTGIAVSLLRPIINGMTDARGFKDLRLLAFTVAALYIMRGLATYGQIVLLSRTGNSIIARLQARLYDHLLHQNIEFFRTRHSSEFLARLVLAVNGVRDVLQLMITSIGRDILTALALFAVMLTSDPLMTLIAVCTVPIGALLFGRVIKRIRKFARRSFDGSTQIMATMQETALGIRIIKSFNLEATMQGRMGRSIGDVQRAANRLSSSIAISSPLSETLGGLTIAAAILYGSWRVTIVRTDLGSFFSFMAALLLAYEPIKRLGRLNLDLQTGLVNARLIYEILDAPQREGNASGKPNLHVTEGRIAFDRVDFNFRAREPVLRSLTLTIEPGQTTALVGPSGGGKSTIINLVQHFYEPSAGVIKIDGADIAAVDVASLRNRIAFVSQDVFLFRGSIRENIALGRAGATDAEIFEAARKAHAHDFISAFDAGYDTDVGEHGTHLSGGQRQRVAIARAILKDAPIILLDEPTAALDSESEREIQKALDDLRVGRTTVVVAHRLQTIINADRIYVIEAGRAVENGTHDDLIARQGAYQAFFAAQFGVGARSLGKVAGEPDVAGNQVLEKKATGNEDSKIKAPVAAAQR